MTNLVSLKNTIANTLQNTNKRRSHSKFVSSKGLLENSDFKKFIDLYLSSETDFFERIDGYDGFISTQQLESIDYEDFSNHVFFDSAVEKVNYSFSKTINEFPYDSSKYELDQYIKKLDGFSKYVLDNKVKKSINYLNLNGNQSLVIKDKRGNLLNDYNGKSFINNFNPNKKSISFDFWIYSRNIDSEQESCVLQKYSSDYGFLVTLEHQSNSNICYLKFRFYEDNRSFIFKYPIEEDKFNHIFFEINNQTNDTNEIVKNIRFFLNGKEINKNSSSFTSIGNINNLTLNFNNQNFSDSDFIVGNSSHSEINIQGNNLSLNGFNGIIDELKIFIGKKRSYDNILKFKDENINSQEGLILYLKFNEPDGDYQNNNIILDYSGNKLHGLIYSVNSNNGINTFSLDNSFVRNGIIDNISIPLKYENISLNPVLFSSFSYSNREEMVSLAKEYDLENPNSFWKLFPKNIFLEGSDYDNIDKTYINDQYTNSSSVIESSRSINQEIIKLISIWARFFDQLKMYIDSFSELLNFSYDSLNTNKKIDGMILPLALNQLGFKFKELFPFPVQEKLNNKNLSYEEILSDYSIRQIQNILWKRFILNSKDYLMSKGTVKGIKSVFNSFGLETDKFISIKEINGQNRLNIENQYYSNRQNIKFIDFNKHNSIFSNTTYSDSSPYPENKIHYHTSDFTKDIFNLEQDWSFECYINFDKTKLKMYENTQSLFRINQKGSDPSDSFYDNPHINVIFKREKNDVDFGKIELHTHFLYNTNNYFQKSEISNVNLMNGSVYYLCLRKKYNNISKYYEYDLTLSSIGELSYVYSKNIVLKTNQKYEDTSNPVLINYYSINIGEYNYNHSIENQIQDLSYETNFQGKISQIRVYNQYINDNSIRNKTKDLFFLSSNEDFNLKNNLVLNNDFSEIVKDQYSASEELFNFNNCFIKSVNSQGQEIIESIEDNLLRSYIKTGQNLLIDNVISGSEIFSSQDIILFKQNYEIDTPRNSNKVYINSFESDSYKDQYKNYNLNSSNQLHPEYLYHDDQRLYIDFSAVHFLNQDISKLLSINEYFTNILSNSSSLYEQEYFSFKNMRDQYFNRLKNREEINFNMLYQIYKYFDNILEDLLYEAIPSRVNYLGFNFVYESHILERNKYQYKNSDARLPLSSDKEFLYQDYKNFETKFRTDDSSNFNENSIIINYKR